VGKVVHRSEPTGSPLGLNRITGRNELPGGHRTTPRGLFVFDFFKKKIRFLIDFSTVF
jgi:hypothetical protein